MLIELSEEERELVLAGLDGLIDDLAPRAHDGLPAGDKGHKDDARRACIAHDLAARVRRLGAS